LVICNFLTVVAFFFSKLFSCSTLANMSIIFFYFYFLYLHSFFFFLILITPIILSSCHDDLFSSYLLSYISCILQHSIYISVFLAVPFIWISKSSDLIIIYFLCFLIFIASWYDTWYDCKPRWSLMYGYIKKSDNFSMCLYAFVTSTSFYSIAIPMWNVNIYNISLITFAKVV